MSSETAKKPKKKTPRRHGPAERPGPEGGKRAENRRRRLRAIERAGLELFLERGVESVTIDEIVGGAGIAKGSFYRYFRDKEDLVEAIMAPVAEGVTAALAKAEQVLDEATTEAQQRAAYFELAVALAQAFIANPDPVKLYLQEGRGPAVGARRPLRQLADRVMEQTVKLTRIAREHGLLRPFPARVSALAVIGATEQLTFRVLSGEDLGDLSKVPGDLISLVMDGLRP
ncbi:MAG: TetR/AcrR family transcriptional regulator [Myxococcales bacterium]|nr:TetR/AcrR family transcriptional regulator [Myxococcales bacterium]